MGLSACGVSTPQRVATYVAPEIVNNLPRRIVVAPIDAPACVRAEKALIRHALADELQSLLVSEIVAAPQDDANLRIDSAVSRRGNFDAETFVNARRAYGADAFMFASVTRYRAYRPPVIGLKIRMFSATTGKLLWASEALLDATREDVVWRAERYCSRSALSERLSGSDIVLTVPKYYAAFVAAQIVDSFRMQALPPPAEEPAGH
jgi:hypothetical protein